MGGALRAGFGRAAARGRGLVGLAALAALVGGGPVARADGAGLRAVDHWLPPPVDEATPPVARSYLVGNEGRHDLFAPWIAGRGGAYLGVGSEQNYTMIALARPALVFLLDRDPRVIALHRELGRRIAAAEAPERLLAGLAAPPAGALAGAWPAVSAHLARIAGRPNTWLSDHVLYDIVRETWRKGHVYGVIGDLGGARAMPSIAAAAGARGAAFTVVYLSNAEEGIVDRRALADNLAALPRAPGAVVLRTYFRAAEPAADGLWSYQVQALADLLGPLGGGEDPGRAAATAIPGLTVIAAPAGGGGAQGGAPGGRAG